ncbi:MAG: tRNA pseudouridine(55) synthase TruB [Gemmatimonadota bacterium]
MRPERARTEPATDGALLVDKPAGPTSHDVVRRVRRRIGVHRVGHTGTLDPFASGLLILLVGRATRLADAFHLLPKCYEAEIRLGRETSTDDPTGEVISEGSWEPVRREDALAALERLTGPIRQTPPSFSAVRVGGERAYRWAREGRSVRLRPRTVTVHGLELAEFDPPRMRIRATVSTGTYIRALGRDLGRFLGCGAHVSELRRTSIGPFRVEDAAAGAGIGEEDGPDLRPAWRPPAHAVGFLRARELEDAEREGIVRGQAISAGDIRPPAAPAAGEVPTTWPVALLAGGDLVGLAEEDGAWLRPRTVFA